MKALHIFDVVCLAAGLLVFGCKDSSKAPEAVQREEPVGLDQPIDTPDENREAPPKAPVSKELRIVDARQLPGLDDPIGPLDDGRIKTSLPEGWYVMSRSRQWIIRLKMSRTMSYPRIGVTAEDYENIFNVSGDNVDEFAEQIATALGHSGEAAKLAGPVAPIKIGSFVGITYQRRAKVGKNFVDRLLVETVVTGRKYTIELWALRGTLKQYRSYLMATAAGIEFLESDKPEKPQPQPGKTPDGAAEAPAGKSGSQP